MTSLVAGWESGGRRIFRSYEFFNEQISWHNKTKEITTFTIKHSAYNYIFEKSEFVDENKVRVRFCSDHMIIESTEYNIDELIEVSARHPWSIWRSRECSYRRSRVALRPKCCPPDRITFTIKKPENPAAIKKALAKLLEYFATTNGKDAITEPVYQSRVLKHWNILLFAISSRNEGNAFIETLAAKAKSDPLIRESIGLQSLWQELLATDETTDSNSCVQDDSSTDHVEARAHTALDALSEDSRPLVRKVNLVLRTEVCQLAAEMKQVTFDARPDVDQKERWRYWEDRVKEFQVRDLFAGLIKDGKTNTEALDILIFLADYYTYAGKLQEAIKIFRENSAAVDQYCTPEMVAVFYERLANIYSKSSGVSEALEAMEKALKSHQVLRPLTTISLKTTLAQLHLRNLNIEQARACIDEALALLQSSNSGEEHVEYNRKRAECHAVHGQLSLRLCHYQEAEFSFRQEQLLQRSAWRQAVCERCLGDAKLNLSQFEAAELLFKNVHAIFTTLLCEPDHQEIAKCLVRLGDVYYLQGKFGEAEKFHTDALEMRIRCSATEHEVAASHNRLGVVYCSLGNADKAKFHCSEALSRRSRIYEKRNTLLKCRINYPTFDGSDDDVDDILEEHDLACAGGLEDNPLSCAAAIHRRGDIYLSKGSLEKALDCYNEAKLLRAKLLPYFSPSIVASLDALGTCHFHRGNYDAAYSQYKEAYALRTFLFEKDHVDVATSHIYLAAACLKLNRSAEASSHLESAADIYETTTDDVIKASFGSKASQLRQWIEDIKTTGDMDGVVVETKLLSVPCDPVMLI